MKCSLIKNRLNSGLCLCLNYLCSYYYAIFRIYSSSKNVLQLLSHCHRATFQVLHTSQTARLFNFCKAVGGLALFLNLTQQEYEYLNKYTTMA